MSPGPDAGCPVVCVPGPIPALCARPEGHPGRHAVQWNEDDERRMILSERRADAHLIEAHVFADEPRNESREEAIAALTRLARIGADHHPELANDEDVTYFARRATLPSHLCPACHEDTSEGRVCPVTGLRHLRGEPSPEEMGDPSPVKMSEDAGIPAAIAPTWRNGVRAERARRAALPIPPPAAPAPGKEPAWLMQERAAKTREWLGRIDAAVAKAVTDRDAEWEARLHAPASNDADAFVASLAEAWGARPSAEAAVRAWQASRAAPAPLAGVLSPGEAEAIEGRAEAVLEARIGRASDAEIRGAEHRSQADMVRLLRSHAAMLAALATERELHRMAREEAARNLAEVSRLSAEIDRLHEICRDVMRERDGLKAKVGRAREAMAYFRDNYDCDADAHRYGTTCRACEAGRVLAAISDPAPDAERDLDIAAGLPR